MGLLSKIQKILSWCTSVEQWLMSFFCIASTQSGRMNTHLQEQVMKSVLSKAIRNVFVAQAWYYVIVIETD